MSDIEATGHVDWVPIPLDADADSLEAGWRARFGDAREVVDSIAFMLGVRASLLRANADADESQVLNLAGWVMTTEPDDLSRLSAYAVLRAFPASPALDAENLVAQIVGDEPVFSGPQITEMETKSGDAVNVVFRPFVGDEVHEHLMVLWPRPDQGIWFQLAAYQSDLLTSYRVQPSFEELAAGIEGL
ncbi:hypothetical protein [Mumia zhuanghuii]|uniref:Uncharacterized protein n=1 Tax=Mumia zhuanghuii TaxID=2585211 RepID=A0A5C4MA38_9ACTN|nr:hypothetical protein [Mumia zhuanghuii]TNC29848.1 hypothetical protein FHE65_33385 [Mumia zhuanghuii]TNC37103.1 hypothetical protein FHE65_25340 [Mumia zhuanghuii]